MGPIKRGFALLAMLAFLQGGGISIATIGTVLTAANFVISVKLAFSAGRWVQQLETHDKAIEATQARVARLERDFSCRAEDCPVRTSDD